MVLNIQFNFNKSFIVVCLYRPPGTSIHRLETDSKSFDLLMTDLNSFGRNIFILGDFNLPTPKAYSHFLRIFKANSLSQLVDKPTRLNNILDLFITNNKDVVNNLTVWDPHISDHHATKAIITIPRPVFNQKTILYRDFKNMNYGQLAADICNIRIPPTSLPLLECINEFSGSLLKVFDTHAPLIMKNIIERPRKTELSLSTMSKKAERDIAYKEYQYHNSAENKLSFELKNREVKKCIAMDNKNTINNRIHKEGVYNAINSLCKLNNKKENIAININANIINEYFIQISSFQNETRFVFPDKPESLISPLERFTIREVSQYDLLKTWKSMKKTKSTSADVLHISPIMIDLSIQAPNIMDCLLKIINNSISECYVPSEIKISKVIPLAKVPIPTDPSHLRPISMQCVIGKIIEKCIYSQLNQFINSNRILHNCQFGFREKHSTCHAQVALTDLLFSEIDKDNVCILVSLDLRKAFDKVHRQLLVHKMSKWYNIHTAWFNSYLSDRSQFVQLNGNTSSTGFTDLGVPQGGILSTILFSLLINDLPLFIKDAWVFLFADDTNFVISGPPSQLPQLLQKINVIMGMIIQWMKLNFLILNVDKTQMMVIGKPQVVKSLGCINIVIDNTNITFTQKVKSLGLIIDSELSWAEHISLKTKKCNSILWSLYPIQSSLSISNRKLLINAYVLPCLNYMCIIWGTANKTTKLSLENIIRKAGRFVLSLRKYDQVKNEITQTLKWLFPDYMYQYEVLKLAFSIFDGSCPPYFVDYLDTTSFITKYTRRNMYTSSASVIQPHCSFGKRSFKYNAAKLWFGLDVMNVNLNSISSFKNSVKKYLLNKQSEHTNSADLHENVCNLSCIDDVVNYNSDSM